MKTEYIDSKGKSRNAEKIRNRMHIYNVSVKGLRVRQEYRDKNREVIREYIKDYFKKRRALALLNGLCGNCQKFPKLPDITFCVSCRDNVRRNANNRRLRLLEEKKNKK